MKLEGIRIQNFGPLRDVALGRLWHSGKTKVLKPMTAVIGKNGVGKSALLDTFGFLVDAIEYNVQDACDMRGGIDRVQSQGTTGPIRFDIYSKQQQPPYNFFVYHLAVGKDNKGRPTVVRERLKILSEDINSQPTLYLWLNQGTGAAWKTDEGLPMPFIHSELTNAAVDPPGDVPVKNETDKQTTITLPGFWETIKASNAELVGLEDPRRLGLVTLGAFKKHSEIAEFRRFVGGWYISRFTASVTEHLPIARSESQLDSHGGNLANVVRFIAREHPDIFQRVCAKLAAKIPGIQQIDIEETSDERLLLQFKDNGFQEPFNSRYVSHGTLRLLACLLLLENPDPPTLLCMEEPGYELYHQALKTLAYDFHTYAEAVNGAQVFVTTHLPHFVDGFNPDEVWILEKGEDGFSTARRAGDDPCTHHMVNEDLSLGSLWSSGFLEPHAIPYDAEKETSHH